MAKPNTPPQARSPHTESQQNGSYAQEDVNPDESVQSVTDGPDGAIYENRAGAQTGGTRSPKHAPPTGNAPNTEQQAVAFEGTLTSRVADDPTRQGISHASAQNESAGQRKVVSEREDAQAGVNHSSKIPQR